LVRKKHKPALARDASDPSIPRQGGAPGRAQNSIEVVISPDGEDVTVAVRTRKRPGDGIHAFLSRLTRFIGVKQGKGRRQSIKMKELWADFAAGIRSIPMLAAKHNLPQWRVRDEVSKFKRKLKQAR
jgi:hypothetical protein